MTQINTFHAEQFAYFLGKMKATKEGDGTLLDHSMIVYGSGIADGSQHTHVNLPILIAGRGNGAIKPGRFLKYPEGTPTTNLWLTLLDRMDVHPESVGEQHGPTGTSHHSVVLVLQIIRQKIASGLNGEPVAPGTRSGATVIMNVDRRSFAA